MRSFTKKTLIILCAIACAGSLALTLAAGVALSVDLGPITVHAPGKVVISSAYISDVAGTVSADGQSVAFSTLPDMTIGDQKALTVTLTNTGELPANVTSIAISGQGTVLTFTPTAGVTPCEVVGGALSMFTWDIKAVSNGTAHPIVSIAWS